MEIYGLKNTIIKAENTVSYSDENTTINISVTDKLGTLVSDGGIIRIYENNILLGEAPTHNGVAIIKINPLSTGIHKDVYKRHLIGLPSTGLDTIFRICFLTRSLEVLSRLNITLQKWSS